MVHKTYAEITRESMGHVFVRLSQGTFFICSCACAQMLKPVGRFHSIAILSYICSWGLPHLGYVEQDGCGHLPVHSEACHDWQERKVAKLIHTHRHLPLHSHAHLHLYIRMYLYYIYVYSYPHPDMYVHWYWYVYACRLCMSLDFAAACPRCIFLQGQPFVGTLKWKPL